MLLPYAHYRDRVLAGWLGKCLGGVVGAPYENLKAYHQIALDALWPATMVANDDLDIQVVWLEAMQERGLYLTSRDLADFWQDRCWYWFCEYGVFLYNRQRGIDPPLSGVWNNTFFMESEGCPIRSEIWGFVAPGNPALAADLARRDGQLDHGGVSVELEAFLAAAAAQALVSTSLDEALAAGLSVVAADSPVARAVPDVRAICAQYPDPQRAWRVVIRRYGNRDASKGMTNFAIVLMALFLGGGDFKQTMLLAVNSGWDTDCTAATAGALLGALSGTAGLPADWVERLGPTLICGINIPHKHALITDFADETCLLGVEMAAARNSLVRVTDAPAVTVRPAPAPAITLEIDYPDGPALYNAVSTPIILSLKNPTDAPVTGHLKLQPAPGTTCLIAANTIHLPAGGQQNFAMLVSREMPGGWLPDKNLFTAIFFNDDGELARRHFGLGGARQWQVYGPYWEMWDSVRYPVCPYYNEQEIKPPFAVSMTGDCYNQYARLDRPYLDEASLLREDLPAEIPLSVERGEDHLTEAHLGGFHGQGCYYLVRTLRCTDGPCDASLVIGRSGPVRLWLDGQELVATESMRAWTSYDEPGVKIRLTGEPQRLVAKVLRLTDAFAFSVHIMGKGDPEYKRGVSNIIDSLEDWPVG
jgi:ADP-ribosylglycohydrolase